MSEVRVEVVGIFEQEVTLGGEEHRIAVVLLRDEAGPRELRVPVGSCEALAIQVALEHRHLPRPLTHDLALRLLDRLSAGLGCVRVDSDSSGELRATLHVKTSAGEMEVDARPGDAVALALRADVPIFVQSAMLADSGEVA